MKKEEILSWNRKYDVDHPWWTQKEKELGDKLRKTKVLTKDDLVEIVKWKFKDLPGRKARILGLVDRNSDAETRKASNHVFRLSSKYDSQK